MVLYRRKVALSCGGYGDPPDGRSTAKTKRGYLPSGPASSIIDTSTWALRMSQLKTFPTRAFLLVSSLPSPAHTSQPTYTVMILDILLKEYRKACIFFRKLTKSGLPLDNAALRAGLTGSCSDDATFQVFEEYPTRIRRWLMNKVATPQKEQKDHASERSTDATLKRYRSSCRP